MDEGVSTAAEAEDTEITTDLTQISARETKKNSQEDLTEHTEEDKDLNQEQKTNSDQ